MKYKVGDIVFSTIWNKSVLIKDIRPNRFYLIADLEYLSRTMITYESNLKSRKDDIEKDMEEHQKLCDEIMAIQGIEPIEAEMEQIIHCPEGYIFKDENGNVINATKIVLEKEKKEDKITLEELKKCMNDYAYWLRKYVRFTDKDGNVLKIILKKEKNEDTKGTKVRHKTKGMVETIVGLCKIKYMGAWVDGVIYEGNDVHTGEPMTFVRVKEDFENNFEVWQH